MLSEHKDSKSVTQEQIHNRPGQGTQHGPSGYGIPFLFYSLPTCTFRLKGRSQDDRQSTSLYVYACDMPTVKIFTFKFFIFKSSTEKDYYWRPLSALSGEVNF